MRGDHTSMMWGHVVIHEHEVWGVLVPLGDSDGLDDVLQVWLTCDCSIDKKLIRFISISIPAHTVKPPPPALGFRTMLMTAQHSHLLLLLRVNINDNNCWMVNSWCLSCTKLVFWFRDTSLLMTLRHLELISNISLLSHCLDIRTKPGDATTQSVYIGWP